MESLQLVIYLLFFVVLYLFICDCILKRKEKFLNQQGFRLLRNGIEDVQIGGYFGNIPKDKPQEPEKKEHGEYVPLRAISNVEKKKLEGIVKPILKKINKQVKLRFELVDVESFYQQVEESGNVRLKLDIFAFEKLNHYHRRLLLDVTLDYSVQKIIVNQITLTNAKKLKPIDPTKNRDQYFNQRILTEDNKLVGENEEHDILGQGDSKLPFGKVEFDVKKYDLLDTNYTSWVFPKEYLDKINNSLPVWPCRREDFRWDTSAVNLTQAGKEGCQGINTSYMKRQAVPKFDPGMRQVQQKNPYNWIHHHYSKGDDSLGI